MTGGFDRLLTETELDRFDQVLKGFQIDDQVIDTPAGIRKAQTSTESMAVSRYQERIWFAQQQDPAQILQQVVAYRLGGIPDIARLMRALDRTVAILPELSTRYRFSDDGELEKYGSVSNDGALDIVHVQSRQEAVELILSRQQTSWDSETEPPFKAVIIFCLDEVILSLFLHRIAEEYCRLDDVLTNLAQAYDGKALIGASRNEVFELASQEIAPVAWLRREKQSSLGAVTDFRSPARLSPKNEQIAQRSGICLETVPLPQVKNGAVDIPAALSRFGTRFARFLCRLGGHDSLELHLPIFAERRLGGDGRSFAPQEIAKVEISRHRDLRDVESVVLNQLYSATEDRTLVEGMPTSGIPSVSITWLTDPHHFFPAQSVTLERMPLPTAELRPDFELAIGQDVEGRPILELTAGQQLSRYAGALVLDLFSAELEAEHSEGKEQDSFPEQWTSLTNDRPAEEAGQPVYREDIDSSAIQSAILMEFREALATPDLKANDDFFDFGGHSLVATRIIGRLLHNHGIEVRFNDLFSNPTAGSLARHARIVAASRQTVGNGSVEVSLSNADAGVAPLAHAQMSLWKIYSAFGFTEIFNLPFALDFLDRVDESIFAKAFLDLMKRHEALRTLYLEDEEGKVYQKVVPISELTGYKWFWRSDESENTDRNAEAGYCFDLSCEFPVRLRFLENPGTGRQTLSFLFHHLALDEWSVNLIMDELAEAYMARTSGMAPVFAGEPAPFHQFARSQTQAGVNGRHLEYWTEMLADAPRELVLFPGDTGGSEAIEVSPAAGGWIEMRLEHATSEGLYVLAKDNSASLFNVVYGAISAALQKLGNLSDLVIGTSASGRIEPEFFDTVGYFTTVVAHRVRFGGDRTIGNLVADIKELINGSLPYSDVPIDLVETALGMTPGKDHLFDVFIQLHAQNKLNGNLPTPDGGKIAFRQVDPDKHESHLGLQFEVMEEVIDGKRSIRVLMSYQTRRYSTAQVETIREAVIEMFSRFSEKGASSRRLFQLSQA